MTISIFYFWRLSSCASQRLMYGATPSTLTFHSHSFTLQQPQKTHRCPTLLHSLPSLVVVASPNNRLCLPTNSMDTGTSAAVPLNETTVADRLELRECNGTLPEDGSLPQHRLVLQLQAGSLSLHAAVGKSPCPSTKICAAFASGSTAHQRYLPWLQYKAKPHSHWLQEVPQKSWLQKAPGVGQPLKRAGKALQKQNSGVSSVSVSRWATIKPDFFK